MTALLSFALIVGAFCAFAFILGKIRKSEVKIADSTFWFLFAVSLVLMAIFPQIVFFFSGIFAIESPANFVFLYVIGALVIREFYSTVELSQLRSKLAALAQAEALHQVELNKKVLEKIDSTQESDIR